MSTPTCCRRCRSPLTVCGLTLRPLAGGLIYQTGDVVLCDGCADDFMRWLRAAELFERWARARCSWTRNLFTPGPTSRPERQGEHDGCMRSGCMQKRERIRGGGGIVFYGFSFRYRSDPSVRFYFGFQSEKPSE